MNKNLIHRFLSGNSKVGSISGTEINQMIELFPYCETIRKIDILFKYKSESITYKDSLPKASIYSSNRKALFLMLMKESNQKIFDLVLIEIALSNKYISKIDLDTLNEWRKSPESWGVDA